MRAQAKGLVNGFMAASLMFAPGAMVPPSFAEEGLSTTEASADPDTEAPKPKKKKKAKKAEETVVALAPDAAAPAALDGAAEAPKPKVRLVPMKKKWYDCNALAFIEMVCDGFAEEKEGQEGRGARTSRGGPRCCRVKGVRC